MESTTEKCVRQISVVKFVMFEERETSYIRFTEGEMQLTSDVRRCELFSSSFELVVSKLRPPLLRSFSTFFFFLTPNLFQSSSPLFSSDDSSCATDRVLTDAHFKVLLLDRKNDKLIVCSSLYQGTCHRNQRGDISRKDKLTSAEHVVANDANSSTVAFVAPGT